MPDRSFRERWLQRATLAAIPLTVAAFALAAFTLIGNGNRLNGAVRQGQEAHRAICTLRGDLEQRVAGSRAFLRDHPHGFDGITGAVLRSSINNQQQTIDALSVIHCP